MNTGTTLKKRVLSAFLALVMVLSVLPLSVFAAEDYAAEVTIGNTTTPYSDIVQAFNAAKYASGSVTVKLLDDIDSFATGFSRTDGVQFQNGDVTLDLNGHYIERYNNAAGTNANKKAVFYVTGSAKLTVKDSVGGGEILQPLSEPALVVDSSASLTVLSGTITNTGAGCGIRIDGGTLTVEGGTISGSYDAGICVGGGTVTVTGDPKIHGGKSSALLITGESSVTLSGGTYTTNETNNRSILNNVGKVEDLLADGFRYTDSNGMDVAITADGKGTDSDNVTVSDFGIKYIDADGAEQKCTSFTELTDATTGALTGWYAVTGTVNIEGATGVTGGNTLNLILCDGAELNLNHTLYMLGGSTLNIYGQSGGTGTLIVESSTCQPGIGIMAGFSGGTVTVNIYGGTVTAKTTEGAQPIGLVPDVTSGKVNVTIGAGMKCVRTDDQKTAYAYDNTDGTSITITKCAEHKWIYTEITDDTHDQTCELCGTTETGVTHTTARYKYFRADLHSLICACGKDYGTEYHTYTYAPNSDGLTHTATCKCEYAVDDIEHTYKGEDKICICGAFHSATYDGKNYASLQSAIDAAAPVGGTVTLAQQINENVVVTDGMVTIDLGGNRWSADISYSEKGYVPLTVNGANVTLKNGNLFQGSSTSTYETAIVINGGSVTIEKDVRVRGGTPDRNGQCPSITLNGGILMLKEGATLLSGLQVPENKVLADYLPEGTAFVKCSYDNNSNTVTVSDPQEFVSDVYTANKITEGMAVVSHTHDFSTGTACPCGFNCDHNTVDEATGKCETCGTQVYVAALTKADGINQSYASFADAWIAATDDEGSTLKLLCDITLNKAENGIIAQSGKFTFDLNGKTVSGEITNQLLTVSGTADITVKNGKLINTFSVDRTDINNAYANVLEIDGGAVTLDQVELIAGQIYQGARSYAASIFSGSLTVVSGTFTGMLAVKRDISETLPSVKITSATLHNGMLYSCNGTTDFDYAGLKAFFADGSMLFDENSKYIDITNDNYWITEAYEEDNFYLAGFYYESGAIVKPHTHDTYVDGKCAECDYACPHDSGKNEREASYFEKAICSVCHSEYGDYAKDTTAPTGEIKFKERTWWQTVLNKISFGLFCKEDVSVIITADDDSYSQPGYDEAKHAVKIEYLISDGILSKEAVENSTEFRDYTVPIGFSTEQQYVVYVRLTDHAGNLAYAGSEGFEIDKTAPLIDGMENGGVYYICGGKTITVTDKNIDKATMDGAEISLDENGQYTLPVDSEKHKIVVADKAGNETTAWITVFPSHNFDSGTDTCLNCGTPAAAKVENGDISDRFATGDELFKALENTKYNDATVTLLTDVTVTEDVSASGEAHLKNDLTIDLNGKTLQGTANKYIMVSGGAVRIYSSNGEGAVTAGLCVYGAEASLTMDDGIGEAGYVMFRLGNLTIRSGRYGLLNIICEEENTADLITLYGGSYESIYFATDCPAKAGQILGKGCRYNRVDYSTAQGKKQLSNVSVIPCDHADLNDFVCNGCGMEIFLSAEKNGETTLFGTFEDAIRYAEQNEGCTVKLLQDITLCRENIGSLISNYYIYLETGTYTLDLAGKALTIGDGAEPLQGLTVTGGCNLTVTDTVGGGKIKSSRWGEVFEVRSDSYLTIESGNYTELSRVLAWGSDSLTIKDGKFNCVASKESSDSVSPLTYLADGCAFMLSSGEYANESNVESQYISGRGTQYWIKDVSVVPAPQTIDEQPTDLKFYLTSQGADKYVKLVISTIEKWQGERFRLTFEKADGTVIQENSVTAFDKQEITLSAVNFTASDSGSYRVKLELNGYVLYSNTFNITVAECEHPGYDENNKCTQCECDLAAAIVKGGKTTGYVDFADALTAAQTDENKGCTLKLLADVSGTVTVKSGKFTMDASNFIINGKLNVSKGAALTVSGGAVTGNVICAKGGELTAEKSAAFTGAINCVGEGSFSGCKLAGTVSGKSSLTLTACEIADALSISGFTKAEGCTVGGEVTINNGGSLKSYSGTYKNSILLKSGGTLDIAGGTYTGKITTEPGSTLIVSNGACTDLLIGKDVTAHISGGQFTKITVQGKSLNDCLTAGLAYEDMDTGSIIDGRVGIAGKVKVVRHAHTCVWKTDTHEKLCGCGYVEAVDAEAPVISGIENYGEYYGPTEFTVTDENDFTVWMDGETITLVNGKYSVEPDNQEHTITATDIAGNTVTYRVKFYKIYNVTLPTGAGYTIFHDETTVRHGYAYDFIVQINHGYSKTEDFKVLVNGNKLDELLSDTNSASFAIRNVSEDLVITVEGVADITAPKVEVSIRGNSFKEFMNRITFGLFFKQTQTVEVKTGDEGSGVDKIEYLLSETAFTDKDAITGDWTELTLDDGKATFNIEPSRKAFIYVRVTDNSGNIAVVNSDGVVLYTDAEAITGAQTFTMDSGRDVPYGIKLNGNSILAVYNGTEEIRELTDYSLIENGANAVLMLKNKYLRTLAAGEYTITLMFKPMGEGYVYNYGNDAPAEIFLKLTVEKKVPILDHTPSDGKIYDGKSIGKPTFNTDSDGALTFEYKKAGEDDSAYTTEAPKNVGKYIIRITTAETDTFKAASSTMEFEIQPREVTISDVQIADKTYDGTTNATITNAGTLSVNYDGDNLVIVAGSAAYDNKNVGTDKTVSFTGFELSGFAAGNYRLIAQPASVAADITVKEVTINGAAVETSKIYDGTADAKITNTGTLSENYDGDNLTIVNGTAIYDSKDVGTGKAVTFTDFALAGDAAANYKLTVQPAPVKADIVPKAVTIIGTAVEPTRIYDGTYSAKIVSVGTVYGAVDGDDVYVSAGDASYVNRNAGNGKIVTFTGFTLAGDAAANYELTAQPAFVKADITPKSVTVIGAAVESARIYDGTDSAKIVSVGTVYGAVDGDDVYVSEGKASYDNRNVGSGKAVTFTGFTLAGDAAANYELTAQPASVKADITVREVTIDGTDVEASKAYDGTVNAKITSAGRLSENYDGDNLTIIRGSAAYSDKNVGKDKTVTFTGFALGGDAADNYRLAAQPVSVKADITPKVLTITGLRIKNKQYDGTNSAQIDDMPELDAVVDGDNVELINGIPTFDSVAIGRDISVSFTEFVLIGDDSANYSLVQPSGITASIVEYIASGKEYSVNSNEWINTDFVVTANDGWKLSLTNSATGEWRDTLTASDETDSGSLVFYVRNEDNGVISAAVTQSYKIDKKAPTGEIKLNERNAFQTVLNKITFGLFFKEDVIVKLTSEDDASGIKSVQYYKSDSLLTDSDIGAVTDWISSTDFSIEAKDLNRFIVYVRIEDNAGNITYIGSDGATFDTTAPEIVNVADLTTYYVTKKVAVDDENLESVTLNGEPVGDVFILEGNKTASYEIKALDKAGNETVYTVYMSPISQLSDSISELTVDNVRTDDEDAVLTVEKSLVDLAESFDDGESTDDEWNQILSALKRCRELLAHINEIKSEVSEIGRIIAGEYDIGTVNSDDREDLDKLIERADSWLDGDNLTDSERAGLEEAKRSAEELIDRIEDAKDAAESESISAVDNITGDNVRPEDKDALKNAERELEELLNNFDGNYTAGERSELEDRLDTVRDALKSIENAENAEKKIGSLPETGSVRLKDKDRVNEAVDAVNKLSDNERAILDRELTEKLDGLVKRIAELEKISYNPSVISGAGQEWRSGFAQGAKFISNAERDEFLHVLVDGRELDRKNYTVSDGISEVLLKSEYLETLKTGKHTLTIQFVNGSAVTEFTVMRDAVSPVTGDGSHTSLWLFLVSVSGCAATGMFISIRKKKKYKDIRG